MNNTYGIVIRYSFGGHQFVLDTVIGQTITPNAILETVLLELIDSDLGFENLDSDANLREAIWNVLRKQIKIVSVDILNTYVHEDKDKN